MPVHVLGPNDGLFYDHQPPGPGGVTFTCFNALTGDTGTWDAAVAPALRAKGHGTLPDIGHLVTME